MKIKANGIEMHYTLEGPATAYLAWTRRETSAGQRPARVAT